MRSGRTLWVLPCLALAAGCDDAAECEALASMKARLEEVVRTGVARARMAEAAKQQRAAAKEKADRLMDSLRLEDAESELTEVFRDRAKAHADVGFERTTAEAPDTGFYAGTGAVEGRETVWRFEIRRPKLPSIFPLLDELAASPPLARLSQVYPAKGGGGWVVDLARMVVPQVPIQEKAVALPEPPDPAKIPEAAGFCGSGELRREIDELLADYARVKEAAEETTVALPEAASWKGLFRRTKELADLEVGARSVIADVLQASVESGVELALVSSDGEGVTVEHRGGAKAGLRLQGSMQPRLARTARIVPAPRQVLQSRFIIPNPVATALSSPNGQSDHEHGENEVGGLGLPPPEELEKILRERFGREGRDGRP